MWVRVKSTKGLTVSDFYLEVTGLQLDHGREDHNIFKEERQTLRHNPRKWIPLMYIIFYPGTHIPVTEEVYIDHWIVPTFDRRNPHLLPK